MYDIHVGEQKSLVFPIMCNAYVSIGYADNIPDIEGTPSDTTDDVPYGLWAHEGDFSFEAIVTPYDINGESTPIDRTTDIQIEKVMPNRMSTVTGQNNAVVNQSDYYLSETGNGRLNHEMMIFYNSKFSVSLMNTATNTINSPAEYKIRVSFYDSPTVNIDSSTVITASKERLDLLTVGGAFETSSGFNEEGYRTFSDIGRVGLSAASSGQAVIGVSLNDNSAIAANLPNVNDDGEGIELFTRDGFTYTSLGIVNSRSSYNITMSQDLTTTLDAATRLYVESHKEPKYIDNTHHIAVSYLETGKLVNIFYNGRLVGSGTRNSSTSAFVLERDDILLGRATTNTSNAQNYAYTAKQFMGEMHEMCFENTYKNKYNHFHTLLPKFKETLLYLRFEEVDL